MIRGFVKFFTVKTPNVTMEPYRETVREKYSVFFWKVDPE